MNFDFESLVPEWYTSMLGVANSILWGEFLIGLLIVCGLYFTLSTRFIQLRMFVEMFRLMTEKAETLPDGTKGISPFKAFTISAASRVGTGNIAGVALAIVLGGPGAVFWMWLVAFIGAATSVYESTLAQVYKVKDSEGGFRGGPAYYIEKGLNQRWLGIFFAVLITITFGLAFNGLQSHTIAEAMENAFEIPPFVSGLVIATLTAIVIFGGARWIANAASVIVPVMAVAYIIVVTIVLVLNYDQIFPMLGLIVSNAFGFREVFGGAVGAAILNGFQRGLFSNEAGMGSVPNAAASSAIDHPLKQGLIQSLGVYFDTMVICTATAIIILMYTDLEYGSDSVAGVALTQDALSSEIGPFGGIFIAVVIFMFAYSSILGNYFYSQSNLNYIFNNKFVVFIFKFIVIAFVILAANVDVSTIWNTADMFMALMAITNLLAVIALSKVVSEVIKDYEAQRKMGKNPKFHVNNIKYDLSKTTEWGEDRLRDTHIDKVK